MLKIGIVAAATGNGHISVAKSIQLEFCKRGIDACVYESFYEDLMFSNKFLSDYYNFLMVTSTQLCSKFSELSYISRPDISPEFYKGICSRLKRFLKTNQFDVLISVSHTINASIVKAVNEMNMKHLKFSIVVTDPFYPISLGFDPIGADKYYCCSEVVKQFLLKRIDADKIVKVNYPINQRFLHKFTEEEKNNIRRQLLIHSTEKTILINSGSQGAFYYIDIVKEVMKKYSNIQIIFVCGKNEGLYLLAKTIFKKSNIHVMGFVSNMEELIAISDFVLTKPGANTFFECIYMRKPVLIDGINGFLYQEKGVTDYLLIHNIGRIIDNMDCINKVIDEFMVEEQYSKYVNELNKIELGNGACKIVDDILKNL